MQARQVALDLERCRGTWMHLTEAIKVESKTFIHFNAVFSTSFIQTMLWIYAMVTDSGQWFFSGIGQVDMTLLFLTLSEV